MAQDTDSDEAFIAAAMPAFISESQEQIDAIEQLLLELEDDPADRELLDALFRCAHTVKGSAGIFGLSRVVEFTHHVETLLDRMRDGDIALTPEISTLLLQCNDQIKWLVATAAMPDEDDESQRTLRADLVARLQAITSGGGSAVAVAADHAREVAAPDPEPVPPGGGVWKITAHFGKDTFRNGMDPLSVLKYLSSIGSVVGIHPLLETVPDLESLDPEDCHLGFAIELETGASREDIEGAFSFVIDDCELDVVAPQTPEQSMVKAIEALPDAPRLGELLVSAGAISQDQLGALLSTQQALGTRVPAAQARLGSLLESQAGVPPVVVEAALGKQKRIREQGNSEERYIRVHADRLDAVINLLGELVIASAGATMLSQKSRRGDLIESSENINRLIEEIRNATLGLRMVPIGETFSRFRRVVRDTASSLGKEVQLEIQGGDSELDKSMVEKIADPLMHLVRNSLDHGLEPPQERLASGKDRVGQLCLGARHEAGAIVITIDDDGRGINRERVLQRAWNRGLVEAGVVPSDDAINMLIFEPGFSTAEQVTNLSGRGVGMDVVKRNIEALRGTLKLHSRPGKGLRVDIRLPLTLAIIDGFLVSSGNVKFILPLEAVLEVIDATQQAWSSNTMGVYSMSLRGTALPVVRLREYYAIEGTPTPRASVVVVHSVHGPFGIEVETLMGHHQTVIKPMGELFRKVQGISGSSILGSGEVALILNPDSLSAQLVANFDRLEKDRAQGGDDDESASEAPKPPQTETTTNSND